MPDHKHGALYDNFTAQARSRHGAQHDEFHREGGKGGMDRLTDKFPQRKGVDRYGERFDDFGWIDVDGGHGLLYDEGFSTPTAHTGDHGTWHDQFRPGTQVRYMSDGADYEGVVISLHAGYAKVRSREGADHEVLPSQVLQFRTAEAADHPQQHTQSVTATPGHTDTSVVGGPQGERPSGRSRTAMGGGARRKPDAGMDSPVTHVTGKTLDETIAEVRKLALDYEVEVGKAVDSSETAVQAQSHDTGKSWCPKCRHVCSKVEDGRCPSCGTETTTKPSD